MLQPLLARRHPLFLLSFFLPVVCTLLGLSVAQAQNTPNNAYFDAILSGRSSSDREDASFSLLNLRLTTAEGIQARTIFDHPTCVRFNKLSTDKKQAAFLGVDMRLGFGQRLTREQSREASGFIPSSAGHTGLVTPPPAGLDLDDPRPSPSQVDERLDVANAHPDTILAFFGKQHNDKVWYMLYGIDEVRWGLPQNVAGRTVGEEFRATTMRAARVANSARATVLGAGELFSLGSAANPWICGVQLITYSNTGFWTSGDAVTDAAKAANTDGFEEHHRLDNFDSWQLKFSAAPENSTLPVTSAVGEVEGEFVGAFNLHKAMEIDGELVKAITFNSAITYRGEDEATFADLQVAVPLQCRVTPYLSIAGDGHLERRDVPTLRNHEVDGNSEVTYGAAYEIPLKVTDGCNFNLRLAAQGTVNQDPDVPNEKLLTIALQWAGWSTEGD